jgi:hypothetical protein
MAGYSFTPNQGGSQYFGGGGWGNDLAGFGHSAYAGMSNGMQFANNFYDLQRRVALEPSAQEAAMANYNAQKKQDEMSADLYGQGMRERNIARNTTQGTTLNRLGGYDSVSGGTMANGTPGAAGFTGSATSPVAAGSIGAQVGVVQPRLSQADMDAQNTFADAVLRNKQGMPGQPQQYFQQPAQSQITPVTPQMLGATAPVVETAPVAIDYTQDPQAARNAWIDGRLYG